MSPTVPEALKALFTLGLIFLSHVTSQSGIQEAVTFPVHVISEVLTNEGKVLQ